jgi:hypothetical protein
MTDSTIDDHYRELFTSYTPYFEGLRSQITAWNSGGCEGEFALQSISVQIRPPFKSLSEYYSNLTGESLRDFFKRIDAMFPDFTIGYRFNGSELSLYLTKS